MNYILSILKLALPYLNLLEYLLRNLDANDEGFDDQAADGIRKAVDLLLKVAEQDQQKNPDNIAKGLAGITAYGNGVLAALDQLAQQKPITPEVIAEAESQVQSLNDPAKVYQAKRGADADALANFKVEAGRRLIAIKSAVE